jgi:O-antigen ligase
LLWVLVPLLWTGVLITSVRSSWIGMAITFFIWLFIVRIRGIKQRLLFVAILIVCFLTFDVIGTFINTGTGIGSLVTSVSGSAQANQTINLLITERANAIENPFQEHSMVSRLALWRYIIDQSSLPQLALLGRGIGVLSADSLYITYLAELGYPGLLLIVAILIIFIGFGFKVIDTATVKWTSSIAIAVVTMDIVMAIIGITGSHIHAFPGDSYFWFWNGVLIGLWANRKNIASPEEPYEIASNP